MTKKHWMCSLLDGVGLFALVAAIFTLGGAVWFVDSISQGVLLQAFYYSIALSLASFMVARCVQITNAMIAKQGQEVKALRQGLTGRA